MPKIQLALDVIFKVRKGFSSSKMTSQEEKGHYNKASSRAFLTFVLSPQAIIIMFS